MLFTRTAVALAALASLAFASKQKPPQQPVLGTDTVHGCYSSKGQLTHNSNNEFNTQGKCSELCRDAKKPVGASNSYDCWCGDKYPNSQYMVGDGNCTEPCPGFNEESCGGLNTYTIYNTGLRQSVAESDPDPSSSSSTNSPSSTPTDKAPDVNAPAESTTGASEPQEDAPTNTTGIAVGVVVGIVALGAIITGVFFYMRRKKNSDLEEEHRRNAAVNAFISGGKPPGSSGGLSMSDSRMDPVLNRRLSDGSIADNQDYSRRILRVTNA